MIYLSINPSTHPSIRTFIHPSNVSNFIYQFIDLSVHSSIYPSVHLSIHPFNHLFIQSCIYLFFSASQASFHHISDQNSIKVPLTLVLSLTKDIPVCATIMQKLQQTVYGAGKSIYLSIYLSVCLIVHKLIIQFSMYYMIYLSIYYLFIYI